MNPEQRQRIVYRFFLSVWAMLTLILLFTVGLLVNHLFQQGGNPLGTLLVSDAPAASARGRAPEPVAAGAQRELALYFTAADGPWLQAENRVLDAGPSSVERCQQALAALIAGSQAGLGPVLPQSAEIKAVYLLPDGDLVVDFSGGLLSGALRQTSATQEMLMAQAIAHTLAQPALRGEGEAPVKRVRILVEGAVPVDRFPAHLDLREPVVPDAAWLQSGPTEPGRNG